MTVELNICGSNLKTLQRHSVVHAVVVAVDDDDVVVIVVVVVFLLSILIFFYSPSLISCIHKYIDVVWSMEIVVFSTHVKTRQRAKNSISTKRTLNKTFRGGQEAWNHRTARKKKRAEKKT